MPWVRIDDHFDEHPKMQRVGPLGWGVWLAGLAYCNRNLTDGFIPWAKARSLCTFEVVEDDGLQWDLSRTSGMMGDDIDAEWVIRLLVDAGLWDIVENGRGRCDGFRIHDYDDYQPSREEVQRERQANAERQRRFRDTKRQPDDNATSNTVSNDVSNAHDNGTVTDPPYPTPYPYPNPVSEPTPEPENEEFGAVAPAATVDPWVIATAEELMQAPFVGDELPDIVLAVAHSFQLVPDFRPRDGPALAALFAGWKEYGKKPPLNWSLAWLRWLRKEVKPKSNGDLYVPNGVSRYDAEIASNREKLRRQKAAYEQANRP